MDFTLKGPGDADPALLLRTIEDCRVTSMFASPALLTNLARYASDHDITDVGLERIIAGGAEVPGPLFAAVRPLLGATGEMFSDYGATEALPVTEISGREVTDTTWPETERGAGVCVGQPLPGVEVRIVEIDDGPIGGWDQARELGAGEMGEVVARSPHISEEYFRQPAATAANKIPNGVADAWHRIGDTGYLDDDGRLWVCGRRSHRVDTSAGTAFPLCCEPVFNAHPKVRRSALVGVDDGDGETRAVIGIELRPGFEASEALTHELMARARQNPATQLVDRIEYLDHLPVDRRHNAKIDRPAIAATLVERRNPT
jgi:acyl-CoA synthetase (AMP-forming)/AMP-acid ligase II